MGAFAAMGLGSTLLPGVLWAKVAAGAEVTTASVAAAAEIAGLEFDEQERTTLVEGLKRQLAQIQALHRVPLPNEVAPAIHFDPRVPGTPSALLGTTKGGARPAPAAPASAARMTRAPQRITAVPRDAELAFQPVAVLAELVRTRKVTPTQLTELYLSRIRAHDPVLKCVITVTEERARAQAKQLDDEIARGRWRGPLHGIPWGAKDLLAAKGYKTTWGAGPYRDQVIDADAVVVQRLDDAGAILVAKLTLGELAQGDNWFGGITRNPWWPEQGSSGSSAGPA